MSSMHRILDGEVLVHHLTQDERTLDPDLLARHGRTARTIVSEGPLRLTVMGIAAGGVLPMHSTNAHVTIHLLEGEVGLHSPRPCVPAEHWRRARLFGPWRGARGAVRDRRRYSSSRWSIWDLRVRATDRPARDRPALIR